MTHENEKNRKLPSKAVLLSVLSAVICIATLLIVSAALKNGQEFRLGDYHDADTGALITAFETNGSNENLVTLITALCYQAEVEGKDTGDLIKQYGSELLLRAKNGQADLQKINADEDLSLEIIRLIRKYGAL
jgi:hypothetical protein